MARVLEPHILPSQIKRAENVEKKIVLSLEAILLSLVSMYF